MKMYEVMKKLRPDFSNLDEVRKELEEMILTPERLNLKRADNNNKPVREGLEEMFKDFGYNYDPNNLTGFTVLDFMYNLADRIIANDSSLVDIFNKIDRGELLEDLKAANDQLMEDMTNFEELIEQVNQEYLNAIDNVASTFETLNKEFEYTSSLIQHDMKIIQQLYGDDYAAMDKYYDKQTKNYNDQLSSQKEMVSYWKDLMDKEEVGSDAWKKYKEEWQNATSELNSTVEASIENLLNKYQNTINQIMLSSFLRIKSIGYWEFHISI